MITVLLMDLLGSYLCLRLKFSSIRLLSGNTVVNSGNMDSNIISRNLHLLRKRVSCPRGDYCIVVRHCKQSWWSGKGILLRWSLWAQSASLKGSFSVFTINSAAFLGPHRSGTRSICRHRVLTNLRISFFASVSARYLVASLRLVRLRKFLD